MENDITFQEVLEHWASYGIGFWIAIIAGIAVFVVEIKLAKRGVILSNRDKRIEKAKKAGHMIKAEAIYQNYKRRGGKGSGTGDDLYHCVYEYTVDGVKRRYVVAQSGHYPPRTITLYYLSNPKRVFSSYDHNKKDIVQGFLLYLIPLLVIYLVAKAFGVDFSAFQ